MQRDPVNPFTFSPFAGKLDYPLLDPGEAPNTTVTIACEWLPYVRGALSTLTQQWSWKQDDPAQVLLAQQRAMTLIGMFTECSGLPPALACNYNFFDSDSGWSPVSSIGTWVSGVGFLGVFLGPGDRSVVYITHSFTPPNVLNHLDFVYDSECDGSGPADSAEIQYKVAGVISTPVRIPLLAGHHGVSWDGGVSNVTDIYIGVNTGASACNVKVTAAAFRGYSGDPCS